VLFNDGLVAGLVSDLGIVASFLTTGRLTTRRAEQPRLARARAQQNTQGRENGSY
jgi:hypothetical protein